MAVARPLVTEDEFMNWPDDGMKHELVGGEVIDVPASFEHDVIGVTVALMLKAHAKGTGYIAGAQAGFRMVNGNIRCPDVSFTRKSSLAGRRPGKGFGDRAPDLCIEVISPSEDREQMGRKVWEYFGAGAYYVWHMFPETREIRVFTSPDDSAILGPDNWIDAGELLPGFRCRVSDLFELD